MAAVGNANAKWNVDVNAGGSAASLTSSSMRGFLFQDGCEQKNWDWTFVRKVSWLAIGEIDNALSDGLAVGSRCWLKSYGCSLRCLFGISRWWTPKKAETIGGKFGKRRSEHTERRPVPLQFRPSRKGFMIGTSNESSNTQSAEKFVKDKHSVMKRPSESGHYAATA